jgi:hypothetical protein
LAVEGLKALEIEALSPLEALTKLYELHRKARSNDFWGQAGVSARSRRPDAVDLAAV